MLTSTIYTTVELAIKYDRANYATRDRIQCGHTCPTCAYCVYSCDAYKQESPDSACFCTLSSR